MSDLPVNRPSRRLSRRADSNPAPTGEALLLNRRWFVLASAAKGGKAAYEVLHWWGAALVALGFFGVVAGLSVSALPLWAGILLVAVIAIAILMAGAYKTAVGLVADEIQKGAETVRQLTEVSTERDAVKAELARARDHQETLLWLNDRIMAGSQLLEGWSATKNDRERAMAAKRWESETYDGLGKRVPTEQAYFRVEVNLGPEWFQLVHGPGAYDDWERPMVRRRVYRLTEIYVRIDGRGS